MANSPKVGIDHKLVVGTNDVSYLPTDATPSGTAVLNGPVFVGMPDASPIPKAVLNVGKPAPQVLSSKPPLVTPISVWVDGIHQHIGLKLHKGTRQQEGLSVVKGDRISKGNIITQGHHLVSDMVKAKTFIGGTFQGQFQGVINVQSWKGFDVAHPNKPGHRLRHICLEGPEAGVYIRGRLTDQNVIELPEYWVGLVDPKSITVTLTQVGSSQDLIVEQVEEEKKVIIKSGNDSMIDCYYVIQASRVDGEPLIVEYEGETPADYPGSSDQFSIAGWDYSRGS
jgi:hypothetical protein